MAFTFCTNCGNKIEDGVEKCPYCGHVKGSERSYTYGQAEPSRPQTPTTSEENASQNGGQTPENTPPQAPQENPYANNPYAGQNRSPYGNGRYDPYGMPPPGGFYRPVPDRPMSIGLLIFSIINIVFSCCCSVGFVFGIIALVYTINARQSPTDEEEVRRKKLALIFNIAAVVLTVAFIISFAISYMANVTTLLF